MTGAVLIEAQRPCWTGGGSVACLKLWGSPKKTCLLGTSNTRLQCHVPLPGWGYKKAFNLYHKEELGYIRGQFLSISLDNIHPSSNVMFSPLPKLKWYISFPGRKVAGCFFNIKIICLYRHFSSGWIPVWTLELLVAFISRRISYASIHYLSINEGKVYGVYFGTYCLRRCLVLKNTDVSYCQICQVSFCWVAFLMLTSNLNY